MMMERLRRRAPSSHRTGPTIDPLARRLRVGAAGVLSLALAVLTLTGAATAGAQSSRQAAQASSAAAPVVSSLTTEHMTDPLGIDASQPLLGWVITSAARGVSQSRYEIRVAQDENSLVSGRNLGWDSGTAVSQQSFDVPYGGPALAPQTRYYWQVRVWDNYGVVSPWSQPAWFETAFLDPGQFQGNWISSPTSPGGRELLLRKNFALGSQAITRARLYVAGLSYPYLYVDGHPVSDHVLDTAFTTYNKTVDYSTYDVTHLVHSGADAIAVSLGNGFYAGGADDYPASGEPWQPGQPTLKLELDVWYADGTSARVVSDPSWKVSTGPTTANSPAAETYDARLEKPGWTQVGYNDSGWDGAAVLPGANQVPSYSGTPAADWVWNTAGATTGTPEGTIYLRKTFTVADPSSLSSAVLRVNADDGHMTYVNGTLVSSSPGNVVNGWQTSQVSDIKSLLVPGTNVIAIAGIATDTNANSVIAAAQLDATRIVTDGTWKALSGTPASPPAGWNTIGFDDSSWPAAIVQGAYGISPWGTNIQSPSGPSKVYDFGITTSGWTRITMRGTAGTQVQIEYSEQLNPDGTVQSEGNGSAGQTDTYILKGGGPETYEPKYGWKGYRYVQVTTSPAAPGTAPPPLPDILSVSGVVVHTALSTAGDFHSSSDLLNRMHAAMVNTILNNQYSYGSDTPVYEKGGWTNDNGDYSTSAMANFNAQAYYGHMMQNFDDSQDSAGNIGWLVPTQPGGDNVDPLWGGSFLLIEYNMFQNYDNLAVIRRDYSHMAAYVDDMASQIAPSGYIYQGTTFGDWSVPGNANPPSSEMLGSMFLYREAEDLAIMAGAIGNTADESKYDSLAANIRTAVNNEFYDSANHDYRDPLGLNSHALGGPNGVITSTAYDQTANVYGLAFGLAPEGDQQAIAAGLAANVTAQGNHLATGANGSKYILPMLTNYGYGNLAYLVATNPTAPGWGQWFLQCGATTMWEAWENTSCDSARSRDHAFMGTVDDWLFSGVAGIQATSPGFRTVQVDPSPVGGLTSASGYETTPLGRVSSSWTRSGTSFALTVQVPVGSQASVCVPAASAQSVTESGVPVGSASGVTVTGMQGSCLRLQLGSGTYRFRSTMS
jgi:alpha-L-rhamnosidase